MGILEDIIGRRQGPTGMAPQAQMQEVMGLRPNPTGMTPQAQMQGVAGSRMMPAPFTRATPSFIAGRDAPSPQMAPQMAPPAAGDKPSFGQKISNFFSDEDKVAKLILALEPLRGPGQGGTAAKWAQSHLINSREDQKEGKNTKAYVDYLLSKGVITREQATQMMSSPKMAEALVSASVSRDFATPKETFTAVSGSDLVARGYSVDPNKMYNISSTGKITQVGGGGVNVNLGEDKIGQEYAKQVPVALSAFTDRGSLANRQNSALNNLGRALAGVDTGGFAETKQTILSFADRLGISIDEESLASSQQIQAAARQIIADELRQNKGPQTDFDAQFTGTYLVGLGMQPEANENILSYLKSRNLLDSLYGRLSAGRSYEFESDKKLLSQLNMFNNTLGSTVKSGDEWFTFEEFYKEAKNRGASDMEVLNEWGKLHP